MSSVTVDVNLTAQAQVPAWELRGKLCGLSQPLGLYLCIWKCTCLLGLRVVSETGKSQSRALNDIRAQILATNYHCFAVNQS